MLAHAVWIGGLDRSRCWFMLLMLLLKIEKLSAALLGKKRRKKTAILEIRNYQLCVLLYNYIVLMRMELFLPRVLLPSTEAIWNCIQGDLLVGLLQQLHQPYDLPLLQQRVPASIYSTPQVSVPSETEALAPLLWPEVAGSCQGNGKG